MKRSTKKRENDVPLLEIERKTEREREHQINRVTEGIEMSSFTVCLIRESSWCHCSVLFLSRDLSTASLSVSLCSPSIISESCFIIASVSNPCDLVQVYAKPLSSVCPKNKLHQGTVAVKALKKQSSRNTMDVMRNFFAVRCCDAFRVAFFWSNGWLNDKVGHFSFSCLFPSGNYCWAQRLHEILMKAYGGHKYIYWHSVFQKKNVSIWCVSICIHTHRAESLKY